MGKLVTAVAVEAVAPKNTMAAARKRPFPIARLSLVFMRAAVARFTLFIEKVHSEGQGFSGRDGPR